jgi:hypothetical protein
MKAVLFFIIVIHGLIHLLGFLKATRLVRVPQLSSDIPESAGILWLLATALFLIAGFLFLRTEQWWIVAAPAVMLSQTLVMASWSDAKFGTLPNLVVILAIVPFFADARPDSLPRRYEAAVLDGLERPLPAPLLVERDLAPLPAPVQRYLRYSGALGKPRVWNVRATFKGGIRREADGPWMDMRSEQYNFFEEGTRVFFSKASRFGIPFDGLHLFRGPAATMQIRVASLFTVVDARGPEMNQSETVTLFNDMCLLAPATLIDPRIQWQAVDDLAVRATFTNRGISIRAHLRFNDAGGLVDFVSNDRFETSDGKIYKNYRWSTPIRGYREFEGRRIMTEGDAVSHRPDGDFAYGRFVLASISYNVTAPPHSRPPQ